VAAAITGFIIAIAIGEYVFLSGWNWVAPAQSLSIFNWDKNNGSTV